MDPGPSSSVSSTAQERGREGCICRLGLLSIIALTVISILPGVASAHGGEHTPNIPQWYGLVILLLGFGILGTSIVLERRDRLAHTEHALAGVLLGVFVAALGGIMMVQLSPIDEYSASSMPFPRFWYPIISLTVGFGIVLASNFLGLFRWPRRPRYTVLGILLGLWIAYPALVRGAAEYHHPAGYLIALAVPLTVGYIVWRDGRDVLGQVWQDTVTRRFGLGIGAVMVVFFVFSTGLLSLVPEEGIINGQKVINTPAFITTVPTANPLVTWPAVSFWFPEIPLSGLVSVGTLIIIGLLGSLVSLNAMLAAYQWRSETRADATQSTAGAAAVVGPNACGCCGPMFAQLAVVLLGPSAAAPLYWLFVDFSSPVGSFFFVASVGLLTGGFVYSANALTPEVCSVPDEEQSQSTGQLGSSDGRV